MKIERFFEWLKDFILQPFIAFAGWLNEFIEIESYEDIDEEIEDVNL